MCRLIRCKQNMQRKDASLAACNAASTVLASTCLAAHAALLLRELPPHSPSPLLGGTPKHTHSGRHDPSFYSTFEYLEDKGVQSSAMAHPTWILVHDMFAQYLLRVNRIQDDSLRAELLDSLGIYLLVKFNHCAQSVKEAADKLLSLLVDRFPYVLWSSPFVSATLDILCALADTTEDMDPISVSSKLPLPFAPHFITVPATKGPRQLMVEAFAMHSKEILTQAMSHASRETSAALHDYLSKPLGNSAGAIRARLFAQHTLSQHFREGGAGETVLESTFVAAQNFYRGQLTGILSSGTTTVAAWTAAVLERLVASRKALQALPKDAPDDAKAGALKVLHDCMFQACALLAESLDHVTDIVQALVWTPARLQLESCMRVAVDCWRWVLSLPGCEEDLMAAVEAAWCWTVDQRLGIFSAQHGHTQSREQVTSIAPKEGPGSEVHSLWLGFLQERLDVVKQRSQVHANIFTDVVQYSLKDRLLCLHPCTLAGRCSLFRLAMNVLRSERHIDAHHQVRGARARSLRACGCDNHGSGYGGARGNIVAMAVVATFFVLESGKWSSCVTDTRFFP